MSSNNLYVMGENVNNLKKNISYNFIYQLLILFLPFVTAPYLSRVIGANGIGIYSYTHSIGVYFTYFIMLGLNNHGNRTIATFQLDREKRSRAFFEIYTLQLICSLFFISLYIYYIFYISTNQKAAILQGVFVLSALFDINWFFFGMEKFRITVTRNAIVKILTVVAIFVLVKKKYRYLLIYIYYGSWVFS